MDKNTDIMLERILECLGNKHGAIKDLADDLGLTANAVSNWKKGITKSYKRYVEDIAKYFDISVDYFEGKIDYPIPYQPKKREHPYNYYSYNVESPDDNKSEYGQLTYNKESEQSEESSNKSLKDEKEAKIVYKPNTKKIIVPVELLSTGINGNPFSDPLIRLISLRKRITDNDNENLTDLLTKIFNEYYSLAEYYENNSLDDEEY